MSAPASPSGLPRVSPEVVPHDSRSRILDEIVKDEVTGGARVEHRDSVSAILARGRERVLVTVDEAGSVHVDRLVGSRRPRMALVALGVVALGVVLMIVLLVDRLGLT
jgi:hypothetical protein